MEFMIPRKSVATYKAPRVFVMRCSVSLQEKKGKVDALNYAYVMCG